MFGKNDTGRDAPLEDHPGLTPEEQNALGQTPLDGNNLAESPVEFPVQETLAQQHQLLRQTRLDLSEVNATLRKIAHKIGLRGIG